MPTDEPTLISSIRRGRPTWQFLGWVVTFTLSVAGSWYASRLDTQAQFAKLAQVDQEQDTYSSQTYATRDDLTTMTTTLEKLMENTSEIRSKVEYIAGRVDQLTQ